MRYRKILTVTLLAAGAALMPSRAAEPGSEEYYRRAVQMYGAGNYVGAADQASRYLELTSPQLSNSAEQTAQAAILILRAELRHGDYAKALRLADGFVHSHPGSPLVPEASLLKAQACFYLGEYADAVGIFNTLPFDTFSPQDRNEGRYCQAVALTELGVYDKARRIFLSLSDTAKGDESRFYVAYIDYVQRDFPAALAGFLKLSKEAARNFGVDFFIAQIKFEQRDYPYVLAHTSDIISAARRLERGDHSHESEAERIIGESLYATGSTAEARAALQRHVKLHPSGGRASARYMLGVMAYAQGDYEEAVEWLLPVSDVEAVYGQSANLYLGQAAAQGSDFTSAAIYFDRAAHQPYDGTVAETALYNYAAAVVAGGRVPFGQASTLLEEFGIRYPDSPYAPAVDEYLALGYMAEKRYLKALEKLEGIKRPSPQVQTLIRQLLYELGAAELAASQPARAEYYLRRGADMGASDNIALATRLWLAEALSAQGKHAEAAKAYRNFISKAPHNDPNRAQALYDMGYALYDAGDFKACRKVMIDAADIKGSGALPPALRSDALLRAADCDKYMGNLKAALASYRQAASEGGANGPDYAALQAACMEGLLGNNTAKESGLAAMLTKWPDSPWAEQALYELVSVQIDSDNIPAALSTLQRLQTSAPDSRLLREAMLDVASAYFVQGLEDKAADTYRQIVRHWPTSVQASAASAKLQDYYSRNGQLNQYLNFIDSVPGAPRPEASQLDYLAYLNAVSALENDPDNPAPLQAYLKDYPRGQYRPDVMYALADIYRTSRNSAEALQLLLQVMEQYPHSDAAPGALFMQAEILRTNGHVEEANRAYLDLLSRGGNQYKADAYRGLALTTSDIGQALAYVDKYLASGPQDEQEIFEAKKLKADLLQQAGRTAEAIALLESLTNDTYTTQGGEAVVRLARLYMQQGNPSQAVKLLTAFTDAGCSDLDVLAHGYILLADAFAATGDKRRAALYLESLEENYPGDNQEILTLISNGLKKYK